jgi:hypothetical protein
MRFDENTKLDYVLLLDELPTLYEERFQMIVHRASTLVNLPENNIHLFNDAASSLFSLFSTELSDHYKPTKEHGNLDNNFFSNAEFLYKNLGLLARLNFNLSDSQYFGLLALSMVDEAMFLEANMPTKQHQYDWGQEDEVLVCLTSAIEAVCFGEALAPISSSFSSTIEAEVKRRAQRGSDKRYEPIRKLKNNFLRYLDNQEVKVSNAQSARNYYRSLQEDEKRILCPTLLETNVIRTLTDHLREYQKKITPK